VVPSNQNSLSAAIVDVNGGNFARGIYVPRGTTSSSSRAQADTQGDLVIAKNITIVGAKHYALAA
jgi:hypothetical protein